MRRVMYAIAVTTGLCVAATATAQPGPGGPGRGPGPGPGPGRPGGPDVRKLESELDRLNDRLKELEERLARQGGGPMAKERGPAPREKGPAPKEKGQFAKDRVPAMKDGPAGRFGPDRQPMGRMGGDRRGPSFDGFRGPGMFGAGPDGPGRGFGMRGMGGERRPGADGQPDIARRLDRIINELELLKKDLQSPRR